MSRTSFIVNALTFARAPLIFLWALFAVWHEFTIGPGGVGCVPLAVAACASMFLSGMTDLWDGRLARKWGVVSPLGKMSDPLMDKVFYLVAFPVLTWQCAHQGCGTAMELSLLSLTVFFLLRDTWVTFMRSVGAMYGADVGAMWSGKVRTAVSFPGAGWIYLYLAFRGMVRPDCARALEVWTASVFAVEALLAALTAWSLFAYTKAYRQYLKRALEQK